MEQWFESIMEMLPLSVLFLVIGGSLYTLAKGADKLVKEAVLLSIHWRVPKTLIGATIVSIGTTTPEAAVSVLAAIKGHPGLALGNAVGSIICDTGLILGAATLIAPLPLHRMIVNRQGWIQVSAGFLLVIACFPFAAAGSVFSRGGNLPQWIGLGFLLLLCLYIWRSIRWAQIQPTSLDAEVQELESAAISAKGWVVLSKLFLALLLVIGSSWVLIPAVRETAMRLHVPESIIAATLVAFGTSLPELVTAVTAARKGHGELAVGNVIGADILNVLFVAGAAAAVTPGGLQAPPHFFYLLFPIMLFILLTFRIGILVSGSQMKRPFGFLLLAIYILGTLLGYALKPEGL